MELILIQYNVYLTGNLIQVLSIPIKACIFTVSLCTKHKGFIPLL